MVVGYLLLKFFSPRHALGELLASVGLPVAFHWLGAVVAAAVVGFPLLVMVVAQAMKAVDPRLEIASRTLGRSAWATFWRVTLPLSWPGMLAGSALAFARGLGEFGATIVTAGNIPGKTTTLSLAIYQAVQLGDDAAAYRLLAVSAAMAFAALWVSDAMLRRSAERRS